MLCRHTPAVRLADEGQYIDFPFTVAASLGARLDAQWATSLITALRAPEWPRTAHHRNSGLLPKVWTSVSSCRPFRWGPATWAQHDRQARAGLPQRQDARVRR